MSPKYTLTYFNARGAAEPCRFMFAVAGVEYEDKRVKSEDWPAIKADQPFGQLPVLTVDGKKIPQSKAIFRYVAREHGFYGANSWEAALIDIVFETCDEFTFPLMKWYLEKDPAKKEEEKKNVLEVIPKIFEKLEKCLIHNKNGDGWFVGDKLSLADFVFLSLHERLALYATVEDVDQFPKLKGLVARLTAQKEIAEWIAKRPKTEN
ncbi:hematopoietic prostaglandin D synthase-like [Anneissia japonica]|uniref:hematopoietic prostaglandin D synthase-like n=1 Tax=Anneissia japonica TaxID=1529436 RepID=UPI001425ABC2|nr:hematopoietic prostaglandin D synthase-like [Anneissia japonica]